MIFEFKKNVHEESVYWYFLNIQCLLDLSTF